MTKEEISSLLENILDKEIEYIDPPTPSDWERIEKKFNCQFPEEFKHFINLMSEYSFPGDILNVASANTNGNDTIEFTYQYEMEQGSWKQEYIPFYSIGNGDYFCLSSKECPSSGVYYFAHDEQDLIKEANDFEEWLKQLPDFLN